MILVLVVLALALTTGCAGQPRQLHPLGGNEFTLFPGEQRAPSPITCAGAIDERFACFAAELESKSKGLEVAGAFALVTPDGEVRTKTKTDALNEPQKISADTRFPAASVSKMFLGAAAISLSLDGALDLHRPIASYLPELTNEAGVGAATLHQLLTHTAGLGSPLQCESNTEDLADSLAKHGNQRLLAPPGAVSNYSNLGYTFVALVLERVAQKPFEQLVRERVLLPAGLDGASYGPAQVVVRGHTPGAVEVMPRCRAMWPSGGLVLSVRELALWAHELARPDSKLGQPLLALLTAPHVEADDRAGSAYGYGVQRRVQSGVTIFSHSGRLEDFTAFVAWSPERQLGVAAFANISEPLVVGVGFRALSTFLSISEDWQPPAGAAHPLSAYSGVYLDEVGTLGRVRVSLEDDTLVLDYVDGHPPLLPAGFRFVFEPGAARARYIVTPIGVGERRGD